MHTKYINYATKYTVFYNNLLYLLELNRSKKNQKKADFFRDIAISRNSEQRWKAGTIPAQTTLKRIIEYFNKWLDINLSIDDILKTNLSMDRNKLSIVSDSNAQYDYQTELFLKKYRQLDEYGKKIIAELMDRMTSHGKSNSKKMGGF